MRTLNRVEAGDFLKIHPDTVSELWNAGKLRGGKVGRALVFREDDLLAYLDEIIERQSARKRELAEPPKKRGRPRRPVI